MEQKKSRELNFELLRILSMFIIVIFHYHDWGGIINVQSPLRNKLFGELIAIGGNLGVNLFVLISGYFLVNSKFKTKKILKIILQVWFYSMSIFLACCAFNIVDMNPAEFDKAMLPLTNYMYWFATIYVGLYLVFPILNKLINSLNKKQHKRILVLLGIILSVIPTLVVGTRPFNGELTWFVYLYLISSYIQKYDISSKSNKCLILIIAGLVFFMIAYSVRATLQQLSTSEILHLTQKNSLITLALSVAIFLLFKNIKIKENKIIPFFSKATFGVYLIHINAHLRVYLFHHILRIQNYYDSKLIILAGYVFMTSIVIYLACTIIDTLRRKFLEEPLFKLKAFDQYFEEIDRLMDFDSKDQVKLLEEKKKTQTV